MPESRRGRRRWINWIKTAAPAPRRHVRPTTGQLDEASENWLHSLSPERRAVVWCILMRGQFAEALSDDWLKRRDPMSAGCRLFDALGPVIAMAHRRDLSRTAMSKLHTRLSGLIDGQMLESWDRFEREWEERGYKGPFVPQRGTWRDGALFQEMPSLLADAHAEILEVKMALDREECTSADESPDQEELHKLQAEEEGDEEAEEAKEETPPPDPELRISHRDAVKGRPDLGLPPTPRTTLHRWAKHPDSARVLGISSSKKPSVQKFLVSGLKDMHENPRRSVKQPRPRRADTAPD